MSELDYLTLILRWLHILAGMTAVGGMIFLRCVVMPSIGVLPADHFAAMHDQMRSRWSKIVAISIGVLLVTGLVNFIIFNRMYELPKWYHAWWGVKFLIALAIFFISSVLAGRSKLADRFRKNIRFWLNLNIALAVVVVCISGVLKSHDKIRKPAAATASQSVQPHRNHG